WIFSGTKVANSLKNTIGSEGVISGVSLRKALIGFQFGIALLVLIGMITIWGQLSFIQNSSLGFEARQLLTVPYFSNGSKANALQQQIDQLDGVESVSLSAWVPTIGSGGLSKNIENPNNPKEKVLV